MHEEGAGLAVSGRLCALFLRNKSKKALFFAMRGNDITVYLRGFLNSFSKYGSVINAGYKITLSYLAYAINTAYIRL